MKKNLTKKLAALGLAVITTASMAGCSSKPAETKAPETTTAAAAGAESTEAPATEAAKKEAGGSDVLKVTYSGTPEIHEKQYLMDTFFKNFEEENNCTVEVDFVAQADAVKKIQSEQEGKNYITDIIYADTANMAPYVNGGWMQDITELVNSTGSTYTQMFDNTTNKDGVRYFVPFTFDVYVTCANKKALDYLPDGLTERGCRLRYYMGTVR